LPLLDLAEPLTAPQRRLTGASSVWALTGASSVWAKTPMPYCRRRRGCRGGFQGPRPRKS